MSAVGRWQYARWMIAAVLAARVWSLWPARASAQTLPVRVALGAGPPMIAPPLPDLDLAREVLRPLSPQDLQLHADRGFDQSISQRVAAAFEKKSMDEYHREQLFMMLGGWTAVAGLALFAVGGLTSAVGGGWADHTVRDVGYGLGITGGALVLIGVPCAAIAEW